MARRRYAQDGVKNPEQFDREVIEWVVAMNAPGVDRSFDQMSTAERKQFIAMQAQLDALRGRVAASESEIVDVEEAIVALTPPKVGFFRKVWKVVSGY